MEPLVPLLRSREDDILARVSAAAQRHGYARQASPLLEAWRVSVRGLGDALATALADGAPSEPALDDRLDDPVTRFARDEALRHRARGVTLTMFLGLTKHYREAFVASCLESAPAAEASRRRAVLTRLFDRLELGVVDAWTQVDRHGGTGQLELANRALVDEKNRYLTVLESLLDPVFVADADGRLLYANPAALTLAGQADAVPGAASYGPALATLDRHRPPWLARLLSGPPPEPGTPLVLPSGAAGPRALVPRLCPLLDLSAKAAGVVVVLRDFTEQRVANHERRLYKALCDSITRNAKDGVVMLDAERQVVFWNHAAERISGFTADEMLGHGLDAALGSFTVTPLPPPSTGRSTPPPTLSVQSRRRDGTPADLELTTSQVPTDDGPRTLLIIRDVSQRKQQEAQAQVSARLESVGRLAGGIAHEINTPVQFVMDSLTFLQDASADLCGLARELKDRAEAGPCDASWWQGLPGRFEALDAAFLLDEAPRAVARALEGVTRVGDIVRAMKEFGHPGLAQMQPADLNRVVRNALVVSKSTWKHVATARFDEGPLPPVTCHPEQLGQVVLNLIVNAADAVRERRQSALGTITVRTRLDGPDAVIDVEDTGVGIPPEHHAILFQPFFTTKEPGQGTGQGLALARHTVVDTHGGALTFRSTVGVGTTFTVRLPVAGKPVASAPPEPVVTP